MCPRAAQTCQICENAESKYKCPSCLTPYCSLGCFKKHKETPCAKPSSTDEKPTTSSVKEGSVHVEKPSEAVEKTELIAFAASPTKEVSVARPIHVEKASDVVEKTQLEAIASCSEIREALKDKGLKKLICSIDSSADPLQKINEAMGVEAFRAFTDKILANISKEKDEH